MSGNRGPTTLVLAVAAAMAVTGCGAAQSHAAGTTDAGRPATPAVTAAVAPRAVGVTGRAIAAAGWARPADQDARVHAAGLDLLAAENLTVHYHAHLDVVVDGHRVPVPAGLGISVPDAEGHIPGTHDPAQPGIAPLHTHDTSGILHVESPTDPQFTLGQLFTEWDVALATRQVGSYRDGSGTSVRVFVDGQPLSSDPAGLVLRPHQEIAVVVTTGGRTTTVPPSSYPFPAGL